MTAAPPASSTDTYTDQNCAPTPPARSRGMSVWVRALWSAARSKRSRSYATCLRSAQGRSLCPSTTGWAASRAWARASSGSTEELPGSVAGAGCRKARFRTGGRTGPSGRSRSRPCRSPSHAAACPSPSPARSARPGTPPSGCAVAGSCAARMRTASRPALRAPATDTVATGTPAGICTIDSSESMPSRYFSGTGTPMTGSGVTEASMPGRWAAPPAPAMSALSPRPAACSP